MEEEADRPLETLIAQVTPKRDELIVVHPHGVAGLEEPQQLAGELLVDPLVGFVFRLIVMKARRKVMKQRPQRAVAVPAVVSVEIGQCEIDGGKSYVAPSDDLRLGVRTGRGFAAPTEPHAAGMLECGENPNGQAARGCASSRHRNAIGDTDQPVHRL